MVKVLLSYIHAVPSPRIEISINDERYYGENVVVFSCTVHLPSTVNDGEVIDLKWFGPSGQLGNSSNVTISRLYSTTDGVYQSDVTITGYSPAVNNGEYVCNVTVIPSSQYVIGSSGFETRRVVLTG